MDELEDIPTPFRVRNTHPEDETHFYALLKLASVNMRPMEVLKTIAPETIEAIKQRQQAEIAGILEKTDFRGMTGRERMHRCNVIADDFSRFRFSEITSKEKHTLIHALEEKVNWQSIVAKREADFDRSAYGFYC